MEGAVQLPTCVDDLVLDRKSDHLVHDLELEDLGVVLLSNSIQIASVLVRRFCMILHWIESSYDTSPVLGHGRALVSALPSHADHTTLVEWLLVRAKIPLLHVSELGVATPPSAVSS